MRDFQKKGRKPPFLFILAKFGSIMVKMGHFRIFGGKSESVTFLPIFLTKIQKIQKIRGFGENLADGNDRQAETRVNL